MTDAIITEYAGIRRNDVISRFYQYGSGGVRVLDGRKNIQRVYSFDPASDMMTERDPARPDRILRRLVFDRMGMLEETFSSGSRPRTFRYEQGGRQIVVREGGEYGQVGKTLTFEENGVAETGWGRNGEIERVFVFDDAHTITERAGGWFGNIERTIMFTGMNASLFREPEAFLQFLIFTEWSAMDKEADIQEQVAHIRGGGSAGAGRSPFAYTGVRQPSQDQGLAGGRHEARTVPSSSGCRQDAGIDFIPEGSSPGEDTPRGPVPPFRRSSEISFEERWHGEPGDQRNISAGRSAEIPLQERFESAHREQEPLSRGRSAEISVGERFDSARSEREKLSLGKSVEIPLEERFESARNEREPLSKGRSVDIPLEERFGNAHGEREKLSLGKSVEIPLEERFENTRSEREKLSKGKSAEIPYSERRAGRDR